MSADQQTFELPHSQDRYADWVRWVQQHVLSTEELREESSVPLVEQES